jgi:predicted GH43/DUF377 family glycosyl hydrolase
MFIHDVRDMSIIECVGKDESKPGYGKVKVIRKSSTPTLKSQSLDDKYVNVSSLPWNSNPYGESIRGGTPAILVRGVYLSFFHSVASPIHGRLYFIGAFTFCPEPPFDVHAMSSHPIIFPKWYDGQWLTDITDYTVFPTALWLDHESDQYMYVSVGYRDQDAVVLKIHIDELLESLEHVAECPIARRRH